MIYAMSKFGTATSGLSEVRVFAQALGETRAVAAKTFLCRLAVQIECVLSGAPSVLLARALELHD